MYRKRKSIKIFQKLSIISHTFLFFILFAAVSTKMRTFVFAHKKYQYGRYKETESRYLQYTNKEKRKIHTTSPTPGGYVCMRPHCI